MAEQLACWLNAIGWCGTVRSVVDPNSFDAAAKASELTAESLTWDTRRPVEAGPGDIPTVDVGPYFATGARSDLDSAAAVLRDALERVGFHQLVGHDIDPSLRDAILEQTRRFHDLDGALKRSIAIDQPDHPVGAVGYMPVGARKLPTRERGNPNEAFLVKSDVGIGFDDNRWLPDEVLPGFRSVVQRYAMAMEALARRLLPVYAVALELEPDFFATGFTDPFWRLRMTHYPANPAPADEAEPLGDVGIPPHVDTTFLTLLLPDSPGLVIFSQARQEWIIAPVVPGAFIVNAGELLRQWSNDRVLSTRHFANNLTERSRYSVPFFFNANADYPMHCLPSCHGPDNPPKYPPISYRESQGVVQGE